MYTVYGLHKVKRWNLQPFSHPYRTTYKLFSKREYLAKPWAIGKKNVGYVANLTLCCNFGTQFHDLRNIIN